MPDNKVKYWRLRILALCILPLKHGNADKKNNKRLIEEHCTNIDEDNLEAILAIKGYLIQVES